MRDQPGFEALVARIVRLDHEEGHLFGAIRARHVRSRGFLAVQGGGAQPKPSGAQRPGTPVVFDEVASV